MRVTEIQALVRQHHRARGGNTPMTRLRELRLIRGWSQAELAAKVRMSRRTIGRLERGLAYRHALHTLIRVAEVFDESPSTLFPELRRKKVS